MYERLISGGDITLFSPNDVPNLYTAFCNDQALFKTLYEKYEKDPNIRKRSIPALEIFEMFVEQRVETGRIYLQNIDHTNTHGAFDEEKYPIYQSNLCLEITLPSEPLTNIDTNEGMISLCTLAGINWGNINKPEDFEEPCDIAVRALDELLDYQDYPVKAAEKGTKMFRTLGVGVINFAYALAKRGLKYDDTAFSFTNEYMEAMTYYLIKSSVNLAKEKGKCDNSDDTKYGKGILPIDTYKSYIDDLVGKDLKMDWESLRQDLLTYGIRNATVCALMPSETSSQITNATNGIEPPRSLVSYKGSKDGVLPQVVPEIQKLKNKYDLLWDQKTPEGYLKIMGIIQKYVDQAISSNTSYNPRNFGDTGKIPMSQLIGDLLLAYKLGLKTLYYNNINDGAGESDEEKQEVKDPSELTEEELLALLENLTDGDEECDSCHL